VHRDKPPQDHPHIYLNMGDTSEIVCPYCSTLFRFDPSLGAHEADPAVCAYGTWTELKSSNAAFSRHAARSQRHRPAVSGRFTMATTIEFGRMQASNGRTNDSGCARPKP